MPRRDWQPDQLRRRKNEEMDEEGTLSARIRGAGQPRAGLDEGGLTLSSPSGPPGPPPRQGRRLQLSEFCNGAFELFELGARPQAGTLHEKFRNTSSRTEREPQSRRRLARAGWNLSELGGA
eukprot:489736-Rhodomonas_salina.4